MITVEVKLNQTVKVDFEVSEVLQAINEMPIAPRLNAIGFIINGIVSEQFETLNTEQQNIVINYFDRKLNEFKAIQDFHNS